MPRNVNTQLPDARSAKAGRWQLRIVSLALAAALALLATACSSGSSSSRRAPQPREASGLPSTYQQACRQQGGCATTNRASGRLPAQLTRPLHIPSTAGGRCPTSRGRHVATPAFDATALGRGPVRVTSDNAGDLRHGEVRAPRTSGWLAPKTHFFSVPAYQGPFLVRARSVGRGAPIRIGGTPADAIPELIVPPGPTSNTTKGWREVPAFTFVKEPGCYAWQIDGLTFSEVIVARILPIRG